MDISKDILYIGVNDHSIDLFEEMLKEAIEDHEKSK